MKNVFRLSESQLHTVIKNSVNRILAEMDWKTYANAANKMRDKMSGIEYWGDKNTDNHDKDFMRARRFGQAAQDTFNRDYGFKKGRLDDKDYAEVCLDGKCDYVNNKFSTAAAAFRHNKDGRNWGHSFPHGAATHERTIEDFYDGNPHANDAINAYNKAKTEVGNFKKGNYEYQKGKGWKLKNKNNK